MTDKIAIVLGASGLVGSALVEQLISYDNYKKIVTLTRRPVANSSDKVTNHVVDFDQLNNYTELFHGDVLFSCLGTTKKIAGTIAAQRKVDLEYQFNAAKLAANHGLTHYVLVSSSGANVTSRSAYLKMKGELEQQVLNLPFQRISILQPSLLLGKRANDSRFAESLGSYFLPFVCKLPGLRKYRPIAGHQVAKKMLFITSQSGPKVEYFKLSDLFDTPNN